MLRNNIIWFVIYILLAIVIYWYRDCTVFDIKIIDLIPLISLFFLACMYNSVDFHHEKLLNTSKYLHPLFIFLSISFGVISLIFGIHTEVFTSYDTNINNTKNEFKWFKTSQILDFPVSQIRNKQNAPNTQVDFNNIQDSLNTCHIIVIDFTKSINNASYEINNLLREKIRTVYSEGSNPRLDNLETQYLITPFLISGIYNNQVVYPNEAIAVFFYDGISHGNIKSLSVNGNFSFTAAQIRENDFLSKYFIEVDTLNARIARLKKSSPNVQTSNINDILEAVQEKINGNGNQKIDECQINRCCKGSSCYGKKFEYYKLSIVSDFINSDSTVKSVDVSDIAKLNELKCYKLPGNENSNKTYTADMLIENLIHDFKSANESPVIDFNILDKQKLAELYKKLTLSNYQRKNEVGKSSLSFYFPYQSFNRDKSIRLCLTVSDKSIDTKSRSDFFLRMWNKDNIDDKQFFLLRTSNEPENRKKSIAFNHIFPLTINPLTDSIIIEFESESVIQNKEIGLELASESSQKIRAYSVNLLPRMSTTTCYYLIICYSVFIFCISLILILPNLIVLTLINRNSEGKSVFKQFINKFLISLPIGLGLFIGFLPFSYLITPPMSSFYLTIILIFLLLFSVPHFIHSFNEEIRKADFKFNAFRIYIEVFNIMKKITPKVK